MFYYIFSMIIMIYKYICTHHKSMSCSVGPGEMNFRVAQWAQELRSLQESLSQQKAERQAEAWWSFLGLLW